MNKKPNIIYLNVHDAGTYIQPNGYPVKTPNLQRLAEQGINFRNCFSMGPTCSPSRATLVTGMAPHNNGMKGLAHRGWGLNDNNQHWLKTFKKAGYKTYVTGTHHLIDGGGPVGHDVVLEAANEEERTTKSEDFLLSKPNFPFYLEIGYSATHRTYDKPEAEDDPRWIRPPAVIPDTPQTREDFSGYCASVRRFDSYVGRILNALDKGGLAENTLVVCTTDHGIAFPDMKCTLSDHGIGVFLIMRGPGGFSGGKVIDSLISQIDLFPTLCDIVGIEKPEWLQGTSILPVIKGVKQENREEIHAEINYHAAYEPVRCVRTKRYKYIRRLHAQKVIANCDNSPSRDLWLDHGWKKSEHDVEQLYDLIFDPLERHNLINDDNYRETKEEMRNRLDNWMKQTEDPFLSGSIPPCPGAIMTDAGQNEPNDDYLWKYIENPKKKNKMEQIR